MRTATILALCGLGSAGCDLGSIATVAIGPSFGTSERSGDGLTVSLEYALLAHERSPRPPDPAVPPAVAPPPDPRDRDRGHNLVGIALVGAVNGGWQSSAAGLNAAGFAGIDYIPFLGKEGYVNFGGLLGYGVREDGRGVIAMAPRLGFALAPWTWGDGALGLGLRLQCLLPSQGDLQVCGPALTLTRLELGGPRTP